MKALLLALTLFIVSSGFAQSTLDSIFSNDVCNCLHQNKISSAIDFQNCYLRATNQNYKQIDREIKLYKDTLRASLHSFANQMYDRISVSMIYTCPAYYKLIDTWRYTEMYGVNKDSIKNEIWKMNNNSVYGHDEIFFTNRGMMYFKISDLDNALKDFDKALKLNSSSLQSLIFKAWTMELKQNYDEAYSVYTNLATLTSKNEFNILAAIAKLKKTEPK
jgi:tetratricopeptide (TPR) repeat protein